MISTVGKRTKRTKNTQEDHVPPSRKFPWISWVCIKTVLKLPFPKLFKKRYDEAPSCSSSFIIFHHHRWSSFILINHSSSCSIHHHSAFIIIHHHLHHHHHLSSFIIINHSSSSSFIIIIHHHFFLSFNDDHATRLSQQANEVPKSISAADTRTWSN